MVENNFKFTEDHQLRTFEQQTVFKHSQENSDARLHATSLGLPENIAGTLAYLFGIFSGIVFLLIEKDNRFVRFHAFQSIYLSLAFFAVFTLLGMLPVIGWLSGVILSPIGLVLWIILMLNAHNGKLSKIFYIGDLAEKQTR
ncbi:DUF4870 domain-containing protein [Planococcus chinensis]|uniref:DUF4870 domain-containing protein n=1 Tax=Planococcus chinensis TaxID=272917 RepID=A0ABW4QEZ2_9BACL